MAKRGKRKKLKVGRRPKQVERTPRGYSQLIAQAAVHYQRGQVREAEQIYLRILQQHPNDADVLTCLGWLAYSQGQYERAIQLYQQSLAYNSKANPELHNNMAIALVETGKTNEAIGHLQQAIGLRPDYAEARNNLTQLISSNLSPQQKDSITISPETKTKLQIAITHQQAGKWQDAERIYHKLLQQDPYNVNVIQVRFV
ncbi:MAG: tetratricopeptide repeat protein [Hormoscilla sp. GM102CHS1]|nr:tetratricopeptide repeat protein [Hormoscilla sp. GM102CHS1]